MKKFHVTYFYFATGMTNPSERDYGIIEATTHFSAKIKVLEEYHSPDDYYLPPDEKDSQGMSDWEWMLTCLIAKEV